FTLGARKHASSQRGVLTFRILSNHDEVDVTRSPVRQRTGEALHQTNRAQIDVLVKFAAYGDERVPDGNVIGNLIRCTNSTVEYGVMAADLVFPVHRHH